MSAWPCAAAHMIAVCPPQVSFALMSAPASSKRLGRIDLAAARGSHQRSFAVGILEIGIGAGLEQRVDDRRGADDRGFGEGRRAELVLQFHIRAGFDQRTDQFDDRRSPRRT